MSEKEVKADNFVGERTILELGVVPPTPLPGFLVIFAGLDKKLYTKDSDGTISDLAADIVPDFNIDGGNAYSTYVGAMIIDGGDA